MDSEDAASVAPAGAGLATKAGGEADVAQQQRPRLKDLAGMQCGECDLRCAGQKQVVLWHLIYLVAVPRQEAAPIKCLFSDQDWGDNRFMTLGPDQLDREADQRQLDQDKITLEVGEPRSRKPGRCLGLDQARPQTD